MLDEKFTKICVFLTLVGLVFSSSHHQTCDGSSSNKNIEAVISSHTEHLMALRNYDWGWHNTPEVVLALQLTNQQSFFARNQTLTAMKGELREEMSSISLGKLALYTMAASSLCEDPTNFENTNLLEKLLHRLKKHLRSDGNTRPWYSYALALQALCVNGIGANRIELTEILARQSENGGFGSHESSDATAQMLIALECVRLRNKASISRSLEREINRTINLGASFLKLRIGHILDSVWIGNKYSTPMALLALRVVNRRFHHKTEKKIYRSLSACSPDVDPESAVAQRLMALKNETVISLNESWRCVNETDPMPLEYQLNTVDEQPFECPPNSNFESNPFVVLIDVKLSFEAGARSGSWWVPNVRKGATLLHVMNLAKCRTSFNFATKQTSWGPSVTSINDVIAKSSKNQYWSLQDGVSGDFLTAGINQYRPSDQEEILFKFMQY